MLDTVDDVGAYFGTGNSFGGTNRPTSIFAYGDGTPAGQTLYGTSFGDDRRAPSSSPDPTTTHILRPRRERHLLVPRAAADTLDGGTGDDTMDGGAGNDLYYVDSMSDTILELDGGGIDEVRTGVGSRAAPAFAVYVIPDFVENLTGTAAGNQGVRDNALNNVINMANGNDLIVADAGGVDTISGGGGNDFIYFGGTLTAADTANGGLGTDTVGLIGDYSGGLVLTATTLTGIKRMAMYSGLFLGATPFSYNITTNDATVAAGTEFFVTAASLQTNETLTFNGSAETNGRFTIHGGAGDDSITGGSGNDFFLGRGGNDQLFGGGGADFLIGGAGADQMTGGTGNDVFRYNTDFGIVRGRHGLDPRLHAGIGQDRPAR